MGRVHLLNPGQTFTLADRTLTAVKPPIFDNPITTGFHDDRTDILFSSDCLGALLPEVPDRVEDLDADVLRDGQVRWATIDSPWIHGVDRKLFEHTIEGIRSIEPSMVCSHLPPAPGSMLGFMLGSLIAAADAERFVGPDQAALEMMLAGMAEAPASAER